MRFRTTALQLYAVAALALLTIAGIFVVPYFFPVIPTVSLSYPTGYNNRVAMISLVLGALCMGAVLNGSLGPTDSKEDRLPRWLLWSSILLGLLLPIAIRYMYGNEHGFEAEYFLDRSLQITLHKIPFREFEFAYGPILLYAPVLLHSVLHISMYAAYFTCMSVFTALGMAMLYFVLQHIDMPAAPRRIVYALAALPFPSLLQHEGLNYQPLRPLTTPFAAICVFWIWKHSKAPYLTALAASLAIAVGFEVSAEQGVGLLLGMPAFFILLTVRGRQFPLGATLLHVALAAGIYFAVLKDKWLLAMQSFSIGGNNFPIVPSPWNLAVLMLYACAIILLWRAIIKRDLQHNYVLLILCGIGILPSAMGRSDSTHLVSATSIYIVALMAAQSRRLLRRTLITSLWIMLPLAFYGPLLSRLKHSLHLHTPASLSESSDVIAAPDLPIPRDVTYYSPLTSAVIPTIRDYLPLRLDEGFFSGFENVMTLAQIRQVLVELQCRKGMPILLRAEDTSPIVHIWDTDPSILGKLQLAPVLPRMKRPTISTNALSDYIKLHYRRTNMAEQSRRVWEYIPGS